MKLKPALEKRRKKLLKVLEEDYPEDSGIPWRGKSFIEKHNREVLPLRADKSKEWIIFSWIASDSQEIFKVKTADIEGLRFYSLTNLRRFNGSYINICKVLGCNRLSLCTDRRKRQYCSTRCARFVDLRLCENGGPNFGRLIVTEPLFTDEGVRWKCRCECGNECLRRSYLLRAGNTKSCGCYRVELATRKTTLSTELVVKTIQQVINEYGKEALCASTINALAGFRFTSWVSKRTGKNYRAGLEELFPEWVSPELRKGCTGFFERLVRTLLIKYFPKAEFNSSPVFPEFLEGLSLDIYSTKLGLAIEIDGTQHYNVLSNWHSPKIKQRDKQKTLLCKKLGITLLRFSGEPKDMSVEFNKVIKKLRNFCPKNFASQALDRDLKSKSSVLRLLAKEELNCVILDTMPTFEVLHSLYTVQKLPQHEIAKKFNVSASTVGNWLKLYGISSRPGGQEARPVFCNQTNFTYRTAKEAAKALRIAFSPVYECLNNKKFHTRGYTFMFVDDVNYRENRKSPLVQHKQINRNRRIKNSDGDLFNNLKEASSLFKVSVSAVCTAIRKKTKCAGKTWSYV